MYLVEDLGSHKRYALKKIRCPFGQESIQTAMQEVDAYKLFNSEYVLRAVDSVVLQDRDEGSKVVYIVLPYLSNGNLQDKINDNLIQGVHFQEDELIRLFIEICKGLQVIHRHHVGGASGELGDGSSILGEATEGDDEDVRLLNQGEGTALDEVVPYAHRDIKPANIMLNDNGSPVLMDLGSCSRARHHITSRQEALELQDKAAEHCTLPYRAPELFDVKTGAYIDERVDIWSLGCTLFSLMYYSSPFELATSETGASLNLAICKGNFKFPQRPEYSDGLKNIVSKCLTVDPDKRPFIDEVISMAYELQD